MKAVGARLPRYDGVGHVTGRTQYVDDVRVGKTLWVKAVRSPHHDAGIVFLPDGRTVSITVMTAGDYDASVQFQHDLAALLWQVLQV